ncbi:hypothetical protein ACJMK2_002131 [Sinanodonta woodiana]|uniref:Uncharacterized protein n=1 Tax=Sinanodonta woodiana TaxID=1069815 RepID=A0ABD3XWM8_SINWO
MNHRLKIKLNHEPRKMYELIEKTLELVEVEMVNLRRALNETCNFYLSMRFFKFKITKLSWTLKIKQEKQQLFITFLWENTTSVSGLTSLEEKYAVHKGSSI